MSEKNHKKNSSQKSLAQKLISIMKQVERIPKNGYNDFHKYHYALESDVKEHCREFMAEEGVLMTISIQDVEQRKDDIVRVTSLVTFRDSDSEEVLSLCMAGDGQDKGDKGIYKAITGMTKYALMSMFLIPTGDDPEKDGEKPGKKRGSTSQKGATGAGPSSKATPKETETPQYITPQMKKAIEAIISKQFGDREKFKEWAKARKAIGEKDGKLSINLLSYDFGHKIIDKTKAAIKAYDKWVAGQQDGDNGWKERVSPWLGKLPGEFVNASVSELGYANVWDISDEAHQDELLGRFQAEYDRISAEIAAEMEG